MCEYVHIVATSGPLVSGPLSHRVQSPAPHPFLFRRKTVAMASWRRRWQFRIGKWRWNDEWQWLVDFRGHHFGPRPMNWCFQKWHKKCKKCTVPLSYNIYSLRRIGHWAKRCRCWRHAGNGEDDFKFLWAFKARNGRVKMVEPGNWSHTPVW